MGKALVQRREAKFFPQSVLQTLPSCLLLHRVQDRTAVHLQVPDCPAPTGSVRTQGPSPELMLLPPPGMPSASAARGTPGHLSKPQLRGLHIHAAFLGSAPALLWATSGFATLTWLHCNGFVCLPPSGTWPQGQRLDVSHSSLCPQCVRQPRSSPHTPLLTLLCLLCLCHSRADPAGCSLQPPGSAGFWLGSAKGRRPEGWRRRTQGASCAFWA